MAIDQTSTPPRDVRGLSMRSFRVGDTHVIKLAGELDLVAADDFEQELRRVELTEAHVIAIDLRELTFIDATGVRPILQAQGRSSQGIHRLVLISGTELVQRPFEICAVAHRLPFVDQLPSGDTATHSTTCATA